MMRLLRDFNYSLRLLARRPLFTLVALLSLALGIGANAAIFSVINTVLLEPLSYPGSSRLVRIWETFAGPDGTHWSGTVSTPNLLDWRRQSASFESIGAYSGGSFNLTGEGDPVRILGVSVTPEVLSLLGVRPRLGRIFSAKDLEEGADRVAVISHGLWERRFAADPAIVGSTIGLGGQNVNVIGVMPASFEFPPRSAYELWVPLIFTEQQKQARGSHWMNVIARLRNGTTLEEASSEMTLIARRLEQKYPDSQDNRGARVRFLSEFLASRSRSTLLILWGAVGLVLLIACANVANLMLARASARRREFAVRAAMGAGHGTLVRQILTESLTLSLAGGIIGFALGHWTMTLLIQLPGSPLSRHRLEIDGRVLAFCLAACVLSAVISGLIPALRASRSDLREGLQERSLARASGRDRVRSALVAGEVALAAVVLIGAGLMLRSYRLLQEVDPGLRAENLLTLRIPLSDFKYPEPSHQRSFYRQLLEQVASLPGVSGVGAITLLPIQNWGWNGRFTIEGRPHLSTSKQPFAEFRSVSEEYHRTMGIPLLRGRLLEGSDTENSPSVVLVNRTLAERYWPGESPLGRRITFSDQPGAEDWITVVGVVGDVRGAGLKNPVRAEMYFPYRQRLLWRNQTLVVRTLQDPLSLSETIRRAVRRIDPEQPLYLVRTMQEVIERSTAAEQFSALVFGLFGGVSLVLALAGVYGVISCSVSQRSGEIGIRMALGANRSRILKMVMGDGLTLALVGAALGLTGAAALSRLMSSQLHGVSATDPATYAAVGTGLVAIALLASFLPARRASRVDPLRALRTQ